MRSDSDAALDQLNLISSREACELLSIKRETLYAYVSRGLIRCVHVPGTRSRKYYASDVRRLAARSAARKGHGAVASAALRWGEPVLDSAITGVDESGPRYRGVSVKSLVELGATFESVANLLWDAPTHEPWSATAPPAHNLPTGTAELRPIDRLIANTTCVQIRQDATRGDAAQERARARELLWSMVFALSPTHERTSVAETLARSLRRDARVDPALAAQAINACLVTSADHELNVSTFAARLAASAEADISACLAVALHTFKGRKVGGMCDRLECLFAAMPERRAARREWIREKIERGDSLPGFGHRLYPSGDPRTPPLLERAATLAGHGPMHELAEEVSELTGIKPSVEYGILAVCRALDAPAGTATALFAIARSAGWIAHIFEQRQSANLLRPRARYVGP